MSEVEERINRIINHDGVKCILIVDMNGNILKQKTKSSSTNMGEKEKPTDSKKYAQIITQLAIKARSTIRDLEPLNDLNFLRIRSKKHEIMVSAGTNYFLIVIQIPGEKN